jgi:glutamine synthetase
MTVEADTAIGPHSVRADVPALPPSVHTVELVVADASGILRGKRIPASQWPRVGRSGFALANVIFEWSATCDIREEAPYSRLADGVPDIHAIPMLDTLRVVPWRDGTARVHCRVCEVDGGGPVPIDPRHALEQVLDRAAATGFDVMTALEVEFYLLDPESRVAREDTIQCYSIERGGLYESIMAPMRRQLEEFGVPIEACNTEYAPGQFEINIRYGHALAAVDTFVHFRGAVKEIAAQHGLLATFMAKPFTEHSGSGLHVHQSLWRDQSNAFSDGAGHLSPVGRHYLAGLVEHLPAMTLFGSPTPNALKRRKDYSFCPTTATWGGDNRTVAVRVIEGEGDDAMRIEQRDGSANCNPYLAVAAQVAAGLDGIERELDPPPMAGDGYADESAPRLADNVPDAIAALRASELARTAFDPLLVETFIGYCQVEHDAINAEVSDVERRRYLEAI